jgi:hypothetical protein
MPIDWGRGVSAEKDRKDLPVPNSDPFPLHPICAAYNRLKWPLSATTLPHTLLKEPPARKLMGVLALQAGRWVLFQFSPMLATYSAALT